MDTLANVFQGCLALLILSVPIAAFLFAGVMVVHGFLTKVPVFGPYIYKPYIAPWLKKRLKALWAWGAPYRQATWGWVKRQLRVAWVRVRSSFP